MKINKTNHPDEPLDFTVEELIEAAGGGAELAHKMGFDRRSGSVRVAKWKGRGGIPVDLQIAYRKLFRRLVKRHREAKNGSQKQA